ncbi:rubredoxin [Mycobacterium sp. E2733]|uniref:rubredoxin n=1 Tax=Mycobacterium sp. E2733 TaxID=1834138 RepID=UPI0007FDE262|nr:rubredoxin [Mycobacterium sp. E2733]OBH90528.1 rubredoxin [Mycobacterium sp. E2733]
MIAYRCPGCDYIYDEAKGAPREGFPAGTPFSDIPDDWCCPDCAVREKADFETTSGDDAERSDEEEPDNWIGVNQ